MSPELKEKLRVEYDSTEQNRMSKFEVTLTLELASDVSVEEVSIALRREIATDAFGLRGTFSANVTKKAPEPVLPAMSVVKTNGLN